MPLASRVAIRMALAWLVAGMGAGVVVAAARSGLAPAAGYHAIGPHAVALILGWFAQFVVAVAFWMLPKHPTGPPRGNERAFLIGVLLLNTALGLHVAASLAGLTVLGSASALAVPLSLVACGSQLWPRVKPFAE